MERTTPVIGIIGVGRMGSAMARRLSEDHEVLGYDIRPVDAGIEMVTAPEELLARCDVLLLSLPSPKETRSTFDGPPFRSAFEAGDAVVVDMTTADPGSLRALVEGLGSAGSRVLDSPVLGRPDRCGKWTLPVGGDAAVLGRVRPVLERLAARVEHAGELGSGHIVKLLNNLMFAAINVSIAEVVAACEALGFPAERFVDLVGNSGAATVSPLFRDVAPRMLGGDHPVVFTMNLLAKDLQLAARMCEDVGAPIVSARASQIVMAGALRLGVGEEDTAALVEWYRRR